MKRLFAVLTAALAACTSLPQGEPPAPAPAAEPALPARAPAAKGGYYLDDGPGEAPPDNLGAIADAEPRVEPLHRWANRPYRVFGRDYVPLAKLEPFRQRGMASWYGRRFHGRKTASGEVYDMYAMTAAHTTLPIPSYARVTHVASGRSVVVRVNDRGPFHPGRIIDLSYAAAFKLGFVQAGSAEVEVESLLPGERPLYLQLGAFGERENAEGLRARLEQELSWLAQKTEVLLAGALWRLQVGPYRSADEALSVAQRIEAQLSVKPLVIAR